MSVLLATWGGSGSNCYVSYTDATSYIELGIIDYTGWTDATTVQREASLLRATRELDTLHFLGYRYYTYQALEWPRAFDPDTEWPGYLETGELELFDNSQRLSKEAIQKATCHQAVWYLENREFIAQQNLYRRLGVSQYSERNDIFSESYTFNNAAGGSTAGICDDAMDFLVEYLGAPKLERA